MQYSPLAQIDEIASISLVPCLIGAVLIIGLIFLASAIRVMPEYQRLVVFRLGRSIGAKGPGIVLLVPVVDRAVRADLR